MSLILPKYIESSDIFDLPIEHSWDDSDPEYIYARMEERLQHRIGKISDRGQLVLSCGFAEWISWRFMKLNNDPMLLNKIEAVYAGVIDWRYLNNSKLPSRNNWYGPIRGPLWSAAELLNRMIDLIKRKQFASPESVCLSFLALHVLQNNTPFKDWRRNTIQRFTSLYPIDLENPLGNSIPRAAIDPDYKVGQEAEFLSDFLTNLDPKSNPFLSTAEEMLEAGFEGVPYTL
jgi:hypothetical protein